MMWLAVYDCACDNLAADPADLPDRCPGHDRPRIIDNSGASAVSVTVSREMADLAHLCGWRPCPRKEADR